MTTPIGEFRLGAFNDYLIANSIPVDSISSPNETVEALVITFGASATSEQIAWAENAKSTFDWRAQRALERNTIVGTLSGLNAAQQEAVFRHVIADILRERWALAAAISAITNTPVPVTEPVPT